MKNVLFGLLFLLAAFPAAQASIITFTTPAGSTAGGQPVDATATFTTGAGSLVVTLTNLQADPTSVVQNLSDLAFNLSTGQTSGTLISSSVFALRTIASSGGTYLDSGAGSSTGWMLESGTTNGGLSTAGLRLCDLCAGAAGPEKTIVGPPNGSDLYASANNSIAGNDPHNPFIGQSATFTLTIPGVTSATTVTNAIFSFGTTEGTNVPGGGGPPQEVVPEPATAALLGGGLIALACILRRRKAS